MSTKQTTSDSLPSDETVKRVTIDEAYINGTGEAKIKRTPKMEKAS